MAVEVTVTKKGDLFELSDHQPFMFFFTKKSRLRLVKGKGSALRQAESHSMWLNSTGIRAVVRDRTTSD